MILFDQTKSWLFLIRCSYLTHFILFTTSTNFLSTRCLFLIFEYNFFDSYFFIPIQNFFVRVPSILLIYFPFPINFSNFLSQIISFEVHPPEFFCVINRLCFEYLINMTVQKTFWFGFCLYSETHISVRSKAYFKIITGICQSYWTYFDIYEISTNIHVLKPKTWSTCVSVILFYVKDFLLVNPYWFLQMNFLP